MIGEKLKEPKFNYLLGRLWFLFVFVGSVADTLCIVFTSYSIPISNCVSWQLLRSMYQISSIGGVPYLVSGAIASILISGIYLLFFFMTKKRLGWMRAGLVVYSCDLYFSLSVLLNDACVYGFVDGFHIAFDCISLALHILGVVILAVAVKQAGKIPELQKGKKHGYGGFSGERYFNTVRTLCLKREETYAARDVDFYYHINGLQQGRIAPGETKIIMIDGNYQRLQITASGLLPVETTVPEGRENTTYTIRADYLGGGVSLILERKS